MGLKNAVWAVKYRTVKEFCSCCDKELDEPEISKVRKFYFSPQDIKDYGDWSLLEEEELEDEIPEFIYGTINSYAVRGDEGIQFSDGELDKITKNIRTFIDSGK